MKKMLLVAIVLGLVASVQAASMHQGMQFGQVSAYFWADTSMDGSVVMGTSAFSSAWSIENVNATLYPDYYDPSEWNWSVDVSGRRDRTAIEQFLRFYSRADGDEVSFGQSTSLNSGFDDYQNVLVGDSHAHASISPATLERGSASFYTWVNTSGGGGGGGGEGFTEEVTEEWWSVNFSFHGSFGDGLEGDEIGQTYFGIIPEPTSLVLLSAGGLFLRRRRH